MQLLAAERQVRREDRAQRRDHVERRVQRPRPRRAVVVRQRLPRRLLVDVAVRLLRQRERLLQPLPQLHRLDRRRHAVQRRLRPIQQQRRVPVQRPRLRHPPLEMPVDQREHAVDQIPPRRHQLVVVPPPELAPGEVGVRGFRHLRGQRVAQRVRVVALEVIVDPDRPALARARLAARHRDVLVRRHVVRQFVPARPEQDRRPDHGVEGDVVLADEVVDARVVRLPEVAPGIRLPALAGPLDRGREVADHRLEPDVDALVLPPLDRHRHAPRDVPRDRPVRQPLAQHPPREVEHVRAPMLLALRNPLAQRLAETAQLQEIVLGLAQLRRRPRLPRTRIDQLDRVQLRPARIALIPPRVRIMAARALPVHVPIRQEPPRLRVVEQVLRPREQVPVLLQGVEQPVHHLPVVVRHRCRERVERDPHPLPRPQDVRVEMIDDLPRRLPLVVGPHRDRRAVRIGAGNHGHAVAADAVVAREDVRRQVRAAQLPVVDRPVRVGPGHADENVVAHGRCSSAGSVALRWYAVNAARVRIPRCAGGRPRGRPTWRPRCASRPRPRPPPARRRSPRRSTLPQVRAAR